MNQLIKNTLEAATWIAKVNPNFEDNFYRSLALKPANCEDYDELKPSEFNHLIHKRSDLLKNKGITLLSIDELLNTGKIVWSCPEESVLDGCAEIYSQGFFDISECPPWDTWIGYSHQFPELSFLKGSIISWIPLEHFNKFHSGKEVSILDNMNWIDAIAIEDSLLNAIIGTPKDLKFEEVLDMESMEKRGHFINDKWK